MQTLKKIFSRAACMSDAAWYIWRGALMISCALLVGSAILLISAGPFSPATYDLYRYAREMQRLPVGILLIGVLGSVIIEDIVTR